MESALLCKEDKEPNILVVLYPFYLYIIKYYFLTNP